MDKAVLCVTSLSFSYGKNPVLSEVSLSAYPGEICCLFGPNGSGKTTLFRCCLSLLNPALGTIRVDGKDVRTMTVKEMARTVAYVPQDHQLSFHYRVHDMVLMGRNPHSSGLYGFSDADRTIALRSIRKLGISDIASRSFRELSGGQRQLVLIARALTQTAPLMILDEPTSSLDYNNQVMIWEVLREIAASGIAVVACTHDPNHVLWFCDRVVVLHEGNVLAQGAPSCILTGELLSRMYGKECVIGAYQNTSLVIPGVVMEQKRVQQVRTVDTGDLLV